MNRSRSVLALVLTVVPTFALAAELPLTYRVEEKALKAAVAGTSVTMTLHRNGSCADAPVVQVHVDIADVTFIARLKPFTPKNDAKAPNTAELHHSLLNVIATGPFYLKVVGTGITPVGGACQLQASQARDLVPAVTSVVQRNVHDAGVWAIQNYASPNGPIEPANAIAVDESAAAFLAQLTPSVRYECDLRLGNGPNTDGVWQVPVYGIDRCESCVSAAPDCL
jgi:hypothetical protein